MEEQIKSQYCNFFNTGTKKLTDSTLESLWQEAKEMCKRHNLNINECEYTHGGDSAFVLMFSDYVIKIAGYGRRMSDYVSHSRYILQPIEEVNFIEPRKSLTSGTYCVILQERLNTKDITPKNVINTVKDLLLDHYTALDIREDNYGIDKNGDIKLLDYGELFYEYEDELYYKHYEFCYEKLSSYIDRELNRIRKDNFKKKLSLFTKWRRI